MHKPVKIIVAYDEDMVIGLGGELPWDLPLELKHFREATCGGVVIMGRNTWESIPKKRRPLRNRTNIVLTRYAVDDEDEPFADRYCDSLRSALALAQKVVKRDGTDIWVIGGASVFEEALRRDVVDEIIASEVKGRHQGDKFFPAIQPWEWSREEVSRHPGFDVVRYGRRRESDDPGMPKFVVALILFVLSLLGMYASLAIIQAFRPPAS